MNAVLTVLGNSPYPNFRADPNYYGPETDDASHLGLSCMRHALLCGTYVRNGVFSAFSGVMSAESSSAFARCSTNDNASSCSDGPVISSGEMSSSNCPAMKKWQRILIDLPNSMVNRWEPSRFPKTLSDPGNKASTPLNVYKHSY